MKWQGRKQSGNFDDRRGSGAGGKVVAGGGIIGLIIYAIISFTGGDAEGLAPVLEQLNQSTSGGEKRELTVEEKQLGEMVAVLVQDTEDVWTEIFRKNNLSYKAPTVVLFENQVQTACGGASAAVGPFYCPGDQKVYMDMSFFGELQSRYGAKGGDFAIAYVLAHEIGHHVQSLLGTSTKVRQMQERLSQTEANKLSVALELQADFYAGVWTYHNQKLNQFLEEGDIEEALSAAHAVGDDAIQKKMRGQVVPDSFTHGSSEQRKFWFLKGYQTGDMSLGDTFSEIK